MRAQWGALFFEYARQLAGVNRNFWDKITDIINNPEELLYLLSVEMGVWKF